MEANQQDASMALVPIESFSYSWLVNFPSLEASIDDYHQTYEDSSSSSFIEMDPRLPPSRRFFINKAHESSFKFDTYVSFADDDHSLVHADEIFRDGYVMPYLSKATSVTTEKDYEPLDTKTEKKKMETRDIQSKSPCRKLRRVSKCVLLRYLDFLTPLCKRLRRCRSAGSSGGTGFDARITTLSRSRVYSEETTSSPRVSVADDCYWRRSCDSESSIYEAVLHCKKSFGKLLTYNKYQYL
ncbi:unnamed protein product [Brassica oleracea var. botrytis]|uniref:Membrane-associated kinase regulator 6 n=2 Tax=Brassica TaxID=3705 RepID=A0A3P6AF36_BRAOL|nr:unnamed protein product [Brassica napus]CDY38718.1 BnaC03g15310D [Brassica napus]VDC88175.1 unnamed protein product [Brassica oleracea]